MRQSLSQTVDIETPELVVLSYTVAGLGSRVYAAAIDLAICVAAFIAVLFGVAFLGGTSFLRSPGAATSSTAWATAFLVIAQFTILWGYYVLFEGLSDGQTPGKRIVGLRVVRDGGYSVGFAASAVRNLLRIIDSQPIFTYLFGMAGVVLSKSGKRLGDVVAGTLVVREALVKQPAAPARAALPSTAAADTAPLSTTLTDGEFQILDRWAERRRALEPERRRQLTAQVAARLSRALGDDVADGGDAALGRLHTAERLAREQGLAARQAAGASRERYAIVATGSPRWIAFGAKLGDVQRRGLRALGEDGVREFVSEYRALSVDLARLRTAAQGQASEDLFYLGRLVAGAHNALYRDRRSDARDVLRFLAIDVPAEIRRSYVPIMLAAVMLFGPATIAYTAVVRDPVIANVFIPTSMHDRAEEGVQRARDGAGYIPDPQVLRPVMASMIIANNVQVTFAAFGLGVTAGVGTALILLLNGVSLGGVFGLYASKGIGKLLLAFVAPHGVLELAAICIAGGGGFLLGAALLVPGPRTRRRALAENGRRAIRLIAGSTLLLIVAGTLEGLVSPIPNWPLSLKLAVSATTAVALAAYLWSGARAQPVVDAERRERTAVLGLQ
jgi:uncharacterized membrane protein SpoIIM required for sporulation/uncharacterized RDD family membrane protein YckC